MPKTGDELLFVVWPVGNTISTTKVDDQQKRIEPVTMITCLRNAAQACMVKLAVQSPPNVVLPPIGFRSSLG